MNTKRMRGLLFAAVLAALAVSGCGAGQFMVPGLTLPKDSTIVSQQETKVLEGRLINFPTQDGVTDVMTVNFDNPHGWPAVSAHCDIQLNDHGYRDMMDKLSVIFGTEKLPSHMDDFSGARMYARMKSRYVVLLMDLTRMGEAMQHDPSLPEGTKEPKVGQFFLVVVKMGGPLHALPPSASSTSTSGSDSGSGAATDNSSAGSSPAGGDKEPPAPAPPPG
jgi:hypothetical protein